MNAPHIHGIRKAVTASSVLDEIADALTLIKHEDRLRWTDLGEVLGKSEDQVAKYADGSATMDAVSFVKARAAWGGRFIGGIDRLIEKSGPRISCNQTQHRILAAAVAIEEARHDGQLSIDDIRANRTTFENARDAIDAQLARLGPKDLKA
jgi:hypothetical protein